LAAGCKGQNRQKKNFPDIFELSLPCAECEFTARIEREEAGKKESISALIRFYNGSYRIITSQKPDGFGYDMIIDNAYLYVMNHESKTIVAYNISEETSGGITKKIFLNAGIYGSKPSAKKTVLKLSGVYTKSVFKALRKGTDFYLNSEITRYNRIADGLMSIAESYSPEHEINAGTFVKKEGPVKEKFRIKKFRCRKQSPALFALPAGYNTVMPKPINRGEKPAIKEFRIGK